MQTKNKILKQCEEAKTASVKLANLDAKTKNDALTSVASALEKNKDKILAANKKDVDNAKRIGLKDALVKRLKLDEIKIREIISGINEVVKLEDPVGKELSAVELDKNLDLYKVTVPIGVIGVIFESRPDALVQISALCLKSGNAVILKGGSEAKNSNEILFKIIKEASEKSGIASGWTQLIETREDVKKILKLGKYIDLLIPRGSNSFVKYIQDNTKIPVLGHSEGICHVYVDKDADIGMALSVCYDAKCQYAAVCNAMETLLVHKGIADKFLPLVMEKFIENSAELRLDESSLSILNRAIKTKLLNEETISRIGNKKIIKKATAKDWRTEYNELILSIKIVDNIDEAIEHINKYGSHHTDAIITEDDNAALKFMNLVDSSSVMHNCSTRFSDGFRYGLGAEVGISTNKIHARGPVGLEGLVIYKYKLIGNGQVVADYTGKNAKKFTHRRLR